MHYKNGREAKVGDRVVGTTYNRKDQVAGTLVSLTPGTDQCSAKVGYLETVALENIHNKTYGAVGFVSPADKIVIIQGTEQHGMYGKLATTIYREDYTQCSNLLHVDDVRI